MFFLFCLPISTTTVGKFDGEVEEVIRLEKLLANLEHKTITLGDELAVARPHLTALNSERDELEEKLGKESAALAEERAKQRVLTDQLQDTQQVRAQLAQKVQEQRKTQQKHEDAASALEAELATHEQKKQAMQEELQNELDKTRQALAQAKGKTDKLSQRFVFAKLTHLMCVCTCVCVQVVL
jgi:chromosome segregation ATPase